MIVHFLRQDPDVSAIAVCGFNIDDDRKQPFGWTRSLAGVSDGRHLHPINCVECLRLMTPAELEDRTRYASFRRG